MTLYPPSMKVWTTSTREVAEEADAKFPRSAWTSTYPGHGEISPAIKGQANLGQYAIDLMINSRAEGDAIAAWVWANRKRLGVRYVIWYGRIISETSSSPGVWKRYFNANAVNADGTPNPSKRHTNHVHASRYSNKGYTGPAAEPVEPAHVGYPTPTTKIVYADKVKPGQKDSDSVFWVQVALGIKGTGTYDADTETAAAAFQKSLGDDVDGDLGPLELTALFADHKSLGVSVEAHS